MYAKTPSHNYYTFDTHRTFDIYGRIQKVAQHFVLDKASYDPHKAILSASGFMTGMTVAYEITPYTLLANSGQFQRQVTDDGILLRTSFDHVKLHHLTIQCSRTALNTKLGNSSALVYIPNMTGYKNMYQSNMGLTLETASRYPSHVVGTDDVTLTVRPTLSHGVSFHPLRVNDCFGMILWHSSIEYPVYSKVAPREENLNITFRGKVSLISHKSTSNVWKTYAPTVVLPVAYLSYRRESKITNPVYRLSSVTYANSQLTGRPWKYREKKLEANGVLLHGENHDVEDEGQSSTDLELEDGELNSECVSRASSFEELLLTD